MPLGRGLLFKSFLEKFMHSKLLRTAAGPEWPGAMRSQAYSTYVITSNTSMIMEPSSLSLLGWYWSCHSQLLTV